jgi:uncharacterized membrane protein
MTITNKVYAFLSYLLLVPGWLFVLLFRRKDQHARFHARQSLVLNLFVFLLLAAWFVITWLVVSIPIIGPIFAWFVFAIVIAFFIYVVIAWVTGMVRSFQDVQKPLPIIGKWARKLPF